MTPPNCPLEIQLLSVKPYGDDVNELHLSRPDGFQWRAGDYLWLASADSPAKPFSIANLPADAEIHLQIARIATIEDWLTQLMTHQSGHISEAITQFHWSTSELPMVLFAGGTGITPLMALLQQHLATHSASVTLYWGVRQEKLAYLRAELDHLQQQHDHFHYQLIISADVEAHPDLKQGLMPDLLRQAQLPLPDGQFDVLICGPWAMVNAIHEALPEARIHSLQT
jgi:3-ketosteroid 9alpha-monooxygenase subunit B